MKKKQNEDTPLVSVQCTVYNHEPFIRKCLEGIVMQKTTFKFEVIVHDDASTDKTADIIREYEAKYPDIIKPIYQKTNGYGSERNGRMKQKAWRGKYLALCEGDDYWTDPYKLQKQVDFLNENKDYVSVFHLVDWLEMDSGKISQTNYGMPYIKEYYTTYDLLEFSNFIPSCSVLFRYQKDLMPNWMREVPHGDFALNLILSKLGKTKLLDERMGVYRRHKGGMHGGQTKLHNNLRLIKSYEILNQHLNFNKSELQKANIYLSKVFIELSDYYLFENNKNDALNFLDRAYKTDIGYTKYMLQKIKILFPKVMRLLYLLKSLKSNGIRTTLNILINKIARKKYETKK